MPLMTMRSAGSQLARLVNRSAVPYVAARQSFTQAFATPAPMVQELKSMGSVGTLFAIVTKLANGTSQVDWNLWRKSRDGSEEGRTQVATHAALTVWNRPNDFYTRQELVETTGQHQELVGEQWWVISRSPLSRLPLELWPVRPDRMRPVPDARDFLVGYVYTGPDGEEIPLERDQVIMLRSPDPESPYRGMGPVQTILTDLNATTMAAAYIANFFTNSAEPGGIIEVEKRLSDEEFDEMTERWREQHQGVANAHRVAVLEQGKWVDRKFSMKDMQFDEMRSTSSEVIREAFGFPKPLLGTTDDVNRANAEAAEYMFAKWCLIPRLERIKAALNNDFLPLFFPPGATLDLEFDYVDPVPANAELEAADRAGKASTAAIYLGLGFEAGAVLKMLDIPDMPMKAADAPVAVEDDDVTKLTEAVQKLYLGVPGNKLLTVEEARTVLNEFGAGLVSPPPEELTAPPPAPAPAFGADPAEEGDPAANPPPPGAAANLAPSRHRPWPTAKSDLPDVDHPDLTGVQTSWERNLDALIASWTDISAAQKTDLIAQVHDIVSSGQVTDLLTLTTASTAGADALIQAMTIVGAEAADHVVVEAEEQDVTIAPVPPRRDQNTATALTVAGLLAAGLAFSAAREALRVWNPASKADDVTAHVRGALDALTDAQLKAQLGAALTRAQRDGRINTLRAAPTAAWYASEQLDKNTCGPCKAVNGKWLGNSIIENVNRLYPTGGYIDCQGRDRCRGQVIGIWRPKQVGAE